MELFDTHFHCDEIDVGREEYLHECADGNVKYLMASGFDLASSLTSEKFSEGVENCWFSAGVHPHNASGPDSRTADFERFLSNPKLAAIGEIGLDYYYMKAEREKQISVFEEFLSFALGKSLPAVIHCRPTENDEAAFQDTFSILSDFAEAGGKFALHCYAGNEKWTDKFIEKNAYFGFSGILTFPKADNMRKAIRSVPLDRILLETDAPYLAPVPFRGKKNRSAYLLKTAQGAAAALGITTVDIAAKSTENAFHFFRLKKP